MHRISAVALALACGFGFFVDDATAIEPPALGEGAKVPIHLAFSEPTMTTEIYRAVGEAADIEILFDTQLNAKRIPIDLEGMTAAVAFDRIATTAGQFWVPLDLNTILVADDTPAKRRQHETLYIRTFVLEYVDVKHVDRLLRSLVEVHRLSTHPEIKSIIIRETAAKMVTIERLIEVVDQPRGEVDVEVELLRLRRKRDTTGADLRLDAADFLTLSNSDGAESLARSTVGVMEAGSGSLHLESGKPRSPLTRLDLTLRVRQHPAAEKITLDVTAELLHLDSPNPDGDRAPIAWGQTESTLRLAVGETAVLRFPDTAPDYEIAIALTPVVVWASTLDAGSLEAFSVGAETHIGSRVDSDRMP